MVFFGVILLFTGLEHIFSALDLLETSSLKNQAAVNSLATALFEDEPPDDVVPGYAILHMDSEGVFSLLKFNNRLKRILVKNSPGCQLFEPEAVDGFGH